MHIVDTYVVSWQELYSLGQFSHKMKAIKNLRTAGRWGHCFHLGKPYHPDQPLHTNYAMTEKPSHSKSQFSSVTTTADIV